MPLARTRAPELELGWGQALELGRELQWRRQLPPGLAAPLLQQAALVPLQQQQQQQAAQAAPTSILRQLAQEHPTMRQQPCRSIPWMPLQAPDPSA